MIGAPLMRPDNFRNAITEPVNVNAPMATPSDISTRLWAWMCPGVPMSNASGAENAPAATSTAAMPTSEWNAATSSGIEVIGTRRAITAPMPPPMATPSTTSSRAGPWAGGCAASVVATAMAMPAMPRKLPRRLDAGLDSPRNDRMNRTPATRYRTAARLAFIGLPLLLFLLVHRQHALRYQKAAENIHGCENQRHETKNP